MEWCVREGLIPAEAKAGSPVTSLPAELFTKTEGFTRREVYAAYIMTSAE